MTISLFQPIREPAVVFVDDWFYLSLLRAQRDHADWVRFPLRKADSLAPSFDSSYSRYCFEHFQLDPYHSEQLKPYLWASLRFPATDSAKIARLRVIAQALLNDGVMFEPKPIPQGHFVELWNEPDVDAGLLQGEVTHRQFPVVATAPIEVTATTNQDEAIRLMLQKIARQLDEGIPADAIKIVNARPTDVHRIAALCPLYGFGIANHNRTPLMKHPLGVRYWQLLDTTPSPEAWDALRREAAPSTTLGMIEAIVHRYDDLPNAKPLIRFELETNEVPAQTYRNAVALLSTFEIDPYGTERYHVLNAVDGLFPTMLQDDAYLTDAEKTALGIRTSIVENERRKNQVRRILEATDALCLYQPKQIEGKDTISVELPSSRQINVISSDHVDGIYRSRADLRLLAAKQRYSTKTYGMIHPKQAAILEALGDHPRVFDPQFRPLREATIRRLLGSNVRLSATSLEVFFHCKFHYLLQSLLKIDAYVPSLSTSIGNAVHRHLEATFGDQSPSDITLDPVPEISSLRRNVFELAISKRMEDVVRRLLEHVDQSRFVDQAQESTWSHSLPQDPRFSLYGKIDRIMVYRGETEEFVVVIDYKTGTAKFDPIAFERGTDIQLIVYLELLKHANESNRVSIAGFFYQPIPLARLKREANANPLDKAMKMNGFIRRDETLAKAFDSGGFVKGLKMKADGGFNKLAKTFDDSDLNGYLLTLERLLSTAIADIGQGQFQITPLPLEKNQRVSQSCEYCPFQGVCYLANKAIAFEPEAAEESEDEGAWED